MSNSLITLLKGKKASVELHIIHNLTKTIQPSKPHLSAAANCRKTYWVSWSKLQEEFNKINFDVFKTSRGGVAGFIIHNWEEISRETTKH